MDIRASAEKTYRSMLQIIPQIIGILLLVSLLLTVIPPEWYGKVFCGHPLADPVAGAALGSIAAGNPVTSYVIGGELLNTGISLTAVTAFIVAWVTVGIIQLPVEMNILGKRFAIARNLCGFILAILIAILTEGTLSLLGGIQ
ncbi:hypothetical protein [Methanogenium cariaci]|jgi:uncharacterized membrane protein YraQ (UPF0718 family)